MTTPAGYLQSVVFGVLVTVLVVLYVVIAGVRAIAGDEESGMLALLLLSHGQLLSGNDSPR